MNIQQIMDHLPHRYPLLLADRLEPQTEENVGWGLKQLTINEWFFQGHFPDAPEMPASLLLEAMGQVGATFVLAMPENKGLYLFLMGLDNVTIRGTALPGDTLRICARMLRNRGNTGKTRVNCRIEGTGTDLAEAEYSYVLSNGPAPPED